jgi:hypothetical protein
LFDCIGGTSEEDETRGISYGQGSDQLMPHRTHATSEKRHRHQ